MKVSVLSANRFQFKQDTAGDTSSVVCCTVFTAVFDILTLINTDQESKESSSEAQRFLSSPLKVLLVVVSHLFLVILSLFIVALHLVVVIVCFFKVVLCVY